MLTIIAALCTPLLAQAIRRGGWGLLRQPETMAAADEPAISKEQEGTPAELLRVSHRQPGPRNTLAVSGQDRLTDAERIPHSSLGATRPPDANRPASPVGFGSLVMKPSWRQIMLAFWVLLSGLATTRFLASFARGFYLVRGSVAAANPGLYMAISEALTRLGITAKPELRASTQCAVRRSGAGAASQSCWCQP